MGYLFKNIKIITMDDQRPEIIQSDLLVEGRKITKIEDDIPLMAHKVIDGRDRLILPGFVNTHTHVSMSLLRSYGDDMELFSWLQDRIWPVEAKLTKKDVEIGARLGIGEMLLSGTTTFLDMYQDMEMVGKAVVETGIRGHISRGTIYSGDRQKDKAALQELESLANRFHRAEEGRIQVMAGPHAIYTNNEAFLKKQMAIATEYGLGINIHLAETKKEFDDCLAMYGCTPVEYLRRIGLFEHELVVAAHMVHVTPEDRRIVREYNIGVAHNPKSNLKLGSGIADIAEFLKLGIRVGIGTDGVASNNAQDMVEELRMASLLQKGIHNDATLLRAYEVLRMATLGGAEVLGIDHHVGRLKEGYEGDIIMVDLNQPHFYPRENSPIANLVYSSKSSDIVMTMVAGKILMDQRRLTTIDIKETYGQVGEAVKRIY